MVKNFSTLKGGNYTVVSKLNTFPTKSCDSKQENKMSEEKWLYNMAHLHKTIKYDEEQCITTVSLYSNEKQFITTISLYSDEIEYYANMTDKLTKRTS